jgi:hypothetical protein
MSSRARGDSTRTLAAALLALAAAVSLAPEKAQAGCSEHVVSRPDPLAGVARLDLLRNSSDLPASTHEAPAPGRHPAPCHGPSCSGRAPAPLPSPAVTSVVRVEAWGLLTDETAPDDPGSCGPPPADSPAFAVRRPQPVDRPPRAGAPSAR